MEQFRSKRSIEEEQKQNKYDAFDKMIDLAISQVITLPEAISAFELGEENLWIPDEKKNVA